MIAAWASLTPPKELGSRREVCRQVTILHPQERQEFLVWRCGERFRSESGYSLRKSAV